MAGELKRKRRTRTDSRTKRRHVDTDEDEIHSMSAHESEPLSDGSEGDEEELNDKHTYPMMEDSTPGKKLKKPPKGEELRVIKDATDLYRSTTFKLKIDALLPNVRPKYQRAAALDKFLLFLYTMLNELPSVPPKHPLAASRDLLDQGLAIPYPLPLPTEDTNWKVSFEKPSEILLVGSWALKTSVKARDQHKFGVDVAVIMPDPLFQEKDYLHSRIFHKRAYYLTVIAAALVAQGNVDVGFTSISGDPRLTALVLRPKDDDFASLNAEVRIVAVLSSSCPIPLQRLSPSRCNMRTTDHASSTPLYNSMVAQLATAKPHLLATNALKESVPAFTDALALLRVWANQRGYGTGNRLCVRGFEGRGTFWTGLLELLVHGKEPLGPGLGRQSTKRKPLGKSLSSYQLFKAVLDFLAKHDFSSEKSFVRTKDGHRFPPEDYNSHEAVLVDSSSLLNLLAGVPLSSLDLLRYDAQQTLDLLNNSSVSEDPFPDVFLKEHRDLSSRFDIVARIDLSSAKLREISQHLVLEHGSAYNALLFTLVYVLRRGLGNRAKAIGVLHPTSAARPLTQSLPANPSVIHIGIILDTEHAFRLVDHGPAAAEQDSAAAQEFREFWGDKSELRRFKDGSIVESVVWSVSSSDERAQIPAFILRHVLQRHCGIAADSVRTWQTQFDCALRLPESIAEMYRVGGALAGFKAAMSAFDDLVRVMKALDDQLPLAILNVSPIADALRYTSALSPIAVPGALAAVLPPCARYVAPMEVIIEFEKSGRWPDDLCAVQKIKLAFFETLATALMAAQKGLRASVVVRDAAPAPEIQDQACLEIVTVDGWAFLCRIWHEREATLLKRIIDDRPHIPKALRRNVDGDPKERQAALQAQEAYRRRFIHAPRHHRAVAALCHRYTAFSGTVRLVKRWFASHWLLQGHVSEEAVELLCASVFLHHARSGLADSLAGAPGSKERGFALVLEHLRDWDWTTGMFVPLYDSTEEDSSTDKPSVTVTAGVKPGVWAIATELDSDGFVWTSTGPDAVIARRVRALAKACWECLGGLETGVFNAKTLFAHPTEHYDFLLELDPSNLPRYHQNVLADQSVWARHKKGEFANARVEESDPKLLPGFDPASMFFVDLKRVYQDTFVLFHDPLGGSQFGAIWDPSVRTPRPFRVLGGFSSLPMNKNAEKNKYKDKATVLLNEDAVLNEVQRMGLGLIKRIVIHG